MRKWILFVLISIVYLPISKSQNLNHDFRTVVGILAIDEITSPHMGLLYQLNWKKRIIGIQGTLAKQLDLGLSNSNDPIGIWELNFKLAYRFGKNKAFIQPNIGFCMAGILNRENITLTYVPDYSPNLSFDIDFGKKIKNNRALGMSLFYHFYSAPIYGLSGFYQFSVK